MRILKGSIGLVGYSFIFLKAVITWFGHWTIKMIWWGFDRKNWKTIRQYFAIAQTLSKFAKKEKAAKNLGWLAKRFDELTKHYSDTDTKRAASEISSAKGILDEVSLGYELGGSVAVNIGGIETKYDPNNGSFSWGLKL